MPALLCAQAGSSACTRLLFVELHYAVRQRHDRKAATESQEPPTTCGHAHAGASAAGTARGLPTRTSWLGPCGRTTRYYLRLPLLWRQQGAPAVHPTHSTPWALQCRSLGGLSRAQSPHLLPRYQYSSNSRTRGVPVVEEQCSLEGVVRLAESSQ
eukprot:scaffold866_cov18-Tisochrysis_lutea.AAC.1